MVSCSAAEDLHLGPDVGSDVDRERDRVLSPPARSGRRRLRLAKLPSACSGCARTCASHDLAQLDASATAGRILRYGQTQSTGVAPRGAVPEHVRARPAPPNRSSASVACWARGPRGGGTEFRTPTTVGVAGERQQLRRADGDSLEVEDLRPARNHDQVGNLRRRGVDRVPETRRLRGVRGGGTGRPRSAGQGGPRETWTGGRGRAAPHQVRPGGHGKGNTQRKKPNLLLYHNSRGKASFKAFTRFFAVFH